MEKDPSKKNEESKRENEKSIVLVPFEIEGDTSIPDRPSKGLPFTQRETRIKRYFERLNKWYPGTFGKDENGIFYRNRFLITLEGYQAGIEKETVYKKLVQLRQLTKPKGELPELNDLTFKACDCAPHLILVEGDNIHNLMTGSEATLRTSSGVSEGNDRDDRLLESGSEKTRRTGSGVSGGGRDYLTWLELSHGSAKLSVDTLWKEWNKLEKENLNYADKGKIVAVIDTGLDLFLSNNRNRNSFKLWENDGKRCAGLDDLVGYNFVDGNVNVFDDHGHGTAVSSVFAESLGWYKEYRIMVLKAFDHTGHADSYQQACAIYYAIENGAHVIVASWGGLHFDPNVYLALEKAREAGIDVFAAAGNFAFNISDPETRFFPAVHGAYKLMGLYDPITKLENIHPVAGLTADENDLWEDSDVYPGVIAASGQYVSVIEPSYKTTVPAADQMEQFEFLADINNRMNIPGLTIGYRLGRKSGTSFAAPKVAGLYLKNSGDIPQGFQITVDWNGEQIPVRKVE